MARKAGEIVLEETPFATAVSSAFLGKVCGVCFKFSADLVKCGKCNYAWYCSKACEEADAGTHQDECLVFRKAFKEELVMLEGQSFWELIRLIGRIYTQSLKSNVEHCLLFPEGLKKRNLSDLMAHTEPIRDFVEMVWPLFQKLYTVSTTYLRVTKEDFWLLLGKFLTNPFYIYTYNPVEAKETIGLALYLQASGFNHSCDPDMVPIYSTNPVKVSMKLIKDTPGKEVGDYRFCYGNFTTETTEDRQNTLQANHVFVCDCALCKDTNLDKLKLSGLSRTCPKCGETLIADESESGTKIACLKCGYSEAADAGFVESFNAAMMAEPQSDDEGNYILDEELEKLLKTTESVLDPVKNVAVIRLRESIVEQAWLNFETKSSWVLEQGEMLAKSYEFYAVRTVDLPILYGRLWKAAKKMGHENSAEKYQTKAKDLWNRYIFTNNTCDLF